MEARGAHADSPHVRTPWVSVWSCLALAIILRAHAVRATEPMGSAFDLAPADRATRVAEAADSVRSNAAADSTTLPPPRPLIVPRPRLGIVDTVTILPPVRVDAMRSRDVERATVTRARLERADLVRFQPSNAGDALEGTPGLEVARTGPWSSNVTLRGLGGNRVLVLVDGVRLQSGRGHGAQTSLVSVDRLEAVEVLPGAGGVQYGSDALGGVV